MESKRKPHYLVWVYRKHKMLIGIIAAFAILTGILIVPTHGTVEHQRKALHTDFEVLVASVVLSLGFAFIILILGGLCVIVLYSIVLKIKRSIKEYNREFKDWE